MASLSQKKKNVPAQMRDMKLLEAAVSGNVNAKEQLAVAILPRVRKMVYLSYGNKQDVDDVVQIAMVTVFRDLPGLRSLERFVSWLDTVVFNVVRSEGRKRVRFTAVFKELIDPTDSLQAMDITPEDENIGTELFLRLQYHIEKINPKKRNAAVMSLFFGYVDSEIAEIVGCNVETAKKRIQYGRRELLERLMRDDACGALIKEVAR